MDYETAMDDETMVTAAEARREIRRHCAEWAEFVAEHGEHAEYGSRAVLLWLGY